MVYLKEMKKLLRPSDRILLALGLLGDVLEEMHDAGGLMTAGYNALYGWTPKGYRRHNFVRVFSRELKTANIEKVIKGDKVYFRLTGKGEKRLARDFPLASFQKRRWDGNWRIVIFDISEKKRKVRDRLRAKLRELGLGMMQESVWITPFDITLDLREFLKVVGLEEDTFVLVARQDLGEGSRRLAERIWQLDRLNEKYQKILREWQEEKGSGKGEELIKKLRLEYLEVLINDPFLPRELLPSNWAREKVERLTKSFAR